MNLDKIEKMLLSSDEETKTFGQEIYKNILETNNYFDKAYLEAAYKKSTEYDWDMPYKSRRSNRIYDNIFKVSKLVAK